MLAKHWRIGVYGDLAVAQSGAATFDVRMMPWKYTDGALEYGTVITDDLGAPASLADNTYSEGDKQDNSTNLYLGIKGHFVVTTDNASSAGAVYLYLEESDVATDGSTYWPSDAADFSAPDHLILLCVIDFDAADTKAKNFEI